MSKCSVIFPLAALALACGGTTEPNATLSVVLNNLAALTDGTYEGWVIDAMGTPHSTGTFQYDPSGSYTFDSPIAEPMMFVLTVEPPNDSDPAPSDQKLLGGPFSNGSATLTALGFVTMDPAADFASSPGTHVLLTPTTSTATDDDSGLWLLSPPAPGGAPAMNSG